MDSPPQSNLEDQKNSQRVQQSLERLDVSQLQHEPKPLLESADFVDFTPAVEEEPLSLAVATVEEIDEPS